jgi:hypothetical protein
MNDRRLLQDCLDEFLKLRSWVSADYYRQNISSVVNKLRERLAAIEAEQFRKLKDDFSDTVPIRLEDTTSKFGIFQGIDDDT